LKLEKYFNLFARKVGNENNNQSHSICTIYPIRNIATNAGYAVPPLLLAM
jgi:hypothetical protein